MLIMVFPRLLTPFFMFVLSVFTKVFPFPLRILLSVSGAAYLFIHSFIIHPPLHPSEASSHHPTSSPNQIGNNCRQAPTTPKCRQATRQLRISGSHVMPHHISSHLGREKETQSLNQHHLSKLPTCPSWQFNSTVTSSNRPVSAY
jgi:hypothetical protein